MGSGRKNRRRQGHQRHLGVRGFRCDQADLVVQHLPEVQGHLDFQRFRQRQEDQHDRVDRVDQGLRVRREEEEQRDSTGQEDQQGQGHQVLQGVPRGRGVPWGQEFRDDHRDRGLQHLRELHRFLWVR